MCWPASTARPIRSSGWVASARLILQQALEDEVTEFLGRVHYERARDPVSHRNGYEPRRVVTTRRAVELERPGCATRRTSGSRAASSGERLAKRYRSCGAPVERELGRLKHEWALLPLRVRGWIGSGCTPT
jgi:hypothetical protein